MFSYSNQFPQASHFASQWQSQLQSQINLLQEFAGKALESAERVLELNLAVGHANLEKSRLVAQTLINAKNPQDFLSQSGDLLKPDLNRLLAYGNKLIHIGSETQAEILRSASRSDSAKNLTKFVLGAEKRAENTVRDMAETAEELIEEELDAMLPARAKKAAKAGKTAAPTAKAHKKTAADSHSNASKTTQKTAHQPAAKNEKAGASKPKHGSNFPAQLPAAPSVSVKGNKTNTKNSTASAKSAVKPTVKPAAKSAVKPVAKAAAKSAEKPGAKAAQANHKAQTHSSPVVHAGQKSSATEVKPLSHAPAAHAPNTVHAAPAPHANTSNTSNTHIATHPANAAPAHTTQTTHTAAAPVLPQAVAAAD